MRTSTFKTILVFALVGCLLLAAITASAATKASKMKVEKKPASAGSPYKEDNQPRLKALPSTKDVAEQDYIRKLSVSQLRKYLRDREARCEGCVERRHLVERAMQVRGWMTEDERIVSELTPVQSSAANALSLHHIAAVPTAESGNVGGPVNGGLVAITTHRPQLAAVQLQYGIHCQEPLGNGTQYCHRVATMQ